MVLPTGPSRRSSPRPLTQVHQRSAARGACAQAAEPQRPTGGALTPQAARRDVNPPLGRWHDAGFFPCRRLWFLPVTRQDLMPLARQNDVAQPSLRKTVSACLSHLPSIAGPRQRGTLTPCAMPCRGALLHHAHASIRFGWMLTAVLRAKQPRERECSLMHSAHKAASIVTSNTCMLATTRPMPGPAPERSEAIHATVVNREGHPGS